ncbi:MAG: hypothetical protein OXF51_01810 [Alphaproteobacteria bacterium]|nr:hypothetical protein [Alphaproteobacteria bacterium]
MSDTGWLNARVGDLTQVRPSFTPGPPLLIDWGDKAIPQIGADVLVKVWQPRNPAFHRRYWSLLHAVVDATGQWGTAEELHRQIKLWTGHYVRHEQPNGMVLAELLPTNVASMSKQDFEKFYDMALAAIAVEVGVDAEALLAEVET